MYVLLCCTYKYVYGKTGLVVTQSWSPGSFALSLFPPLGSGAKMQMQEKLSCLVDRSQDSISSSSSWYGSATLEEWATVDDGRASVSTATTTISSTSTASRKGKKRATQCGNCKTLQTPLWRRDSEGQVLCNACGLFQKLHGTTRPVSLHTDVIKRRNSKKRVETHKRAGRKRPTTTTTAAATAVAVATTAADGTTEQRGPSSTAMPPAATIYDNSRLYDETSFASDEVWPLSVPPQDELLWFEFNSC